jgi:hypothetical protein
VGQKLKAANRFPLNLKDFELEKLNYVNTL